jgi:dTDP-4-dehydrorhamnose reductase
LSLLIVGASGHLGGEVARRALAAGYTVTGTHMRPGAPADPAVRWAPLDVRDRLAVHQLVQRVRPSAVLNTASVLGDWAVTASGAANVAAAAAAVGARLVHISSDALHGGRPEPYLDWEDPTPVFAYGAAKAAAETAVAALDPSAAIVRTSLIVGDEHSRQVKLCLDLIEGRKPGALFSDDIRCPVSVDDLADAVLELIGGDYAGVLNVAGAQPVSRVELGRLVAARYGVSTARMPVSTIAEAGLVRPADVKLDSSRAAGMLRARLRPVSEVLAA